MSYIIEVVHIDKHPDAIYVGRGGGRTKRRASPLGNPNSIAPPITRDMACDLYDTYFYSRVAQNDASVMGALIDIHRIGKETGKVKLGCHCAPMRCHASTVKEFLESNQTLLDELLERVSK